MQILFVCSRNQGRSPTAEALFQNHPTITARSAETENNVRVRVTEKLILWVDIIFVMEKKHRQRLREKFPVALNNKQIIVLDIPDEYQYQDAELIEHLRVCLQPYL
ncbi:low molecular weight protein tyrosine phosphatase family protein [Adhaeribacter pallidiroseus]|uniref:Protein-tyrosine-phosphatase n=1 Tax=Adhaeribacter pallidiroseus TaxID=2072847 RepID=A0A369QPD1_9BACT|nr:protein tyrosine phosphatase [Adhaeribacter pallidiroseus]RDC64709.1 Protein-tyrosine-phosphatase [Adhaeribacter pallidiroseus]